MKKVLSYSSSGSLIERCFFVVGDFTPHTLDKYPRGKTECVVSLPDLGGNRKMGWCVFEVCLKMDKNSRLRSFPARGKMKMVQIALVLLAAAAGSASGKSDEETRIGFSAQKWKCKRNAQSMQIIREENKGGEMFIAACSKFGKATLCWFA